LRSSHATESVVHAPGTGVMPTKSLLQAKAGVGIHVLPLLWLASAAVCTDVDADLRRHDE
jgi:hypothetical protein